MDFCWIVVLCWLISNSNYRDILLLIWLSIVATYNQLSLIDTEISNIADLALSSNYSQDNTLFMLTSGSEYSLWRSLNSGTLWERVFTTTLANVDSITLVEFSPQYGNVSQVVFLAGISNGEPAVYPGIVARIFK